MDQGLRDRAVEWVNLNCPELDGAAWDQKVEDVAADLALLDQEADEGDYLDRQYSDFE